ncbi:class I SAM-dependent methyltransferase [Geminicoccus harenae]|uniref:class I SAM-dependent methyltransferase n=1 Tax=Geminicoccus harenae TaxID=2498453 RepID=UPI00351A1CEB
MELVAGRPGSVLELGLGNGRSYDHLRARLPERRIVVVERDPKPHPACMPRPEDLVIGTFETVLPRAATLLPHDLVLVHADIGTGDPVRNACLAREVARQLAGFLPQGCIIAGDQHLPAERLRTLPVPEGVEPGRYHLYRVTSGDADHIMLRPAG